MTGETMITTTDPQTGITTDTTLAMTSDAEVDRLAAEAARAFVDIRSRDRAWRSGMLEGIAAALEADRAGLVTTAAAETGLALARLEGELSRSVFQFRLFAEVVRDGGYLEATIDHAADTPLGPAPDVRRMLVPLGPVAVFGSSNFPFAFSVAGGDTASALAAGCPVILKAHSSHPETSARSFAAVARAVLASGAPDGTVGIVYGQMAGARLVAAAEVCAVGFTGSLTTGETLLRIIAQRDTPIPFFGELSSLNPLIVSAAAVAERGREIATGLFASVTGSGGQLCTKPGIAFIPRGADVLVESLLEQVSAAGSAVLLNRRIAASFGELSASIRGAGAELLAQGAAASGDFAASPTVVGVAASKLTAALAEEVFGPFLMLAFYDDEEQISTALDAVPDSLTATLHTASHETEARERLTALVADRVGRIVYDGYPTGVRVGWAQHHGGPWPATNTQHTSVGATALRRFLRPLAWQDAPPEQLPAELRDGPADVPRRVDGHLMLSRRES